MYLGFSRPLRASLCELRPDKSLEPAEVAEIWVFFLSAERAERKNQSALGAGFDSQYLAKHSGFHLPVLNPAR